MLSSKSCNTHTHTHLPPGNGEGRGGPVKDSTEEQLSTEDEAGEAQKPGIDTREGSEEERPREKRHSGTEAPSVLEPKTSGAAKKSKDRGRGTLNKLQTDLKRQFDSSAMTVVAMAILAMVGGA